MEKAPIGIQIAFNVLALALVWQVALMIQDKLKEDVE
jgi:hypothetical protein|tara:strand:- start:180 stop:290 length:111 start_codon:yes stop_codon:yes gene_type:complete